MADNREFASKGDTPTKQVKGRKSQEKNANDFCWLCGVNLKIKSVIFRKVPNTVLRNFFFKPSGRAKRESKTYADFSSAIGLNIVENSVLFESGLSVLWYENIQSSVKWV